MIHTVFFIIFLLTSCSLFQEKAPDKTGHYINLSDEQAIHHYDIKKALSRTKVMAGGDYNVTAYPFTKSLVTAMANDLTFERGLTKEDRLKLLNTLTSLYLDKKTCFHVRTSVLRFEKAAELKNWKAIVIDHREKEHHLTWGMSHPQIKRFQRRSADKLIKWLNEAVACSDYPVAFLSPFSLKVTASYAPFPFSTESKLHWEFEEEGSPENNKEDSAKKTKSRTKKAYRGW